MVSVRRHTSTSLNAKSAQVLETILSTPRFSTQSTCLNYMKLTLSVLWIGGLPPVASGHSEGLWPWCTWYCFQSYSSPHGAKDADITLFKKYVSSMNIQWLYISDGFCAVCAKNCCACTWLIIYLRFCLYISGVVHYFWNPIPALPKEGLQVTGLRNPP